MSAVYDLPVARPDQAPALELRNLAKSFAGVTVLHGVDLVVERGEIHGLIGPNGSGKSTLVKILAGFHQPDGNPTIRVGGVDLPAPFSVADVRNAGMGFVHQDLALVADCSAADNLGFSAAGFAKGRAGRIHWRRHNALARELFERVGLDVDPDTLVGELTPAEKTLVAIGRALNEFRDESILILDEPTASLPRREVDRLFDSLRHLAASGTALIYISHRLPELQILTDRLTVLRDGRVIASVVTEQTTHEALAELMLGEVETRRVDAVEQHHERSTAPEALRLTRVQTSALQPTDLTLREGELVVLTGPVGCGAAEIGRLLYGLAPLEGGTVEVHGEPFVPAGSPAAAKERGIAYLPADRQGLSSFQDLSVMENVLAADWRSLARAGRVGHGTARREVDRVISEVHVHPPDAGRTFRTLSGGNQQKALVAKWLRLNPGILVMDEPTQGIDIRTRAEMYERIRAEVARGLSVIWITSDFEEASVIADRVLVFVGGGHRHTLAGREVSSDGIGRASLALVV